MSELSPAAAVTLVSVIPSLHGGVGHNLGYHLSVARAAQTRGWRHRALVAQDHGGVEIPRHWRSVLRPGLLNEGLPRTLARGRVFTLLRDVGRYADALAAGLQEELRDTAGDCVVFFDDFNGPQLLGIRLAMARLPRHRLRLWLLYRNNPAEMGVAGRAYRLVTLSLAGLFAPGRIRLLADSEPLAAAVQSSVGMTTHVMPIPHAVIAQAPPFQRDSQEIVCWWPGAPRPEKGLETIRRFACATEPATDVSRIRLVLSETAGIHAGSGAVKVQAIPRSLDAAAYERWLHTADIILLPYDDPRYRFSTSGIFAECIGAGRVPLVSDDTWMAHELRRFGLPELVCDWRDLHAVLATVRHSIRDPEVRRKLQRMRHSYLEFHSEASYAREMSALLD